MAVPSKYGLFDFFEEGSLAVGPLHRVNFGASGVSVNGLNPQDWNPDTEVMVRWGSPGHLYPAKILELSENKHSLLQMRAHLIKGTGDEMCGRGRRKKKRVDYSSSEDESHVIFKKKKTESKGPALTTLEHSREKLTETSATQCANCLRLQQRVRELEEDKQRWTLQMDTINDMKNMFTELRDSLVRGPPSTTLVRGPPSPSSTTSPQPQDNSNDNVLIAEGVEVSSVKLHRCNHQQPKQLVSDLLAAFFSRREMATHSLTGHKSSSTEHVKPALDNIRLNAIFDYTLTKFPMANIKDLRKVVRNRLHCESKMYKKTLKRETRQPDLCTESTSSAEGPDMKNMFTELRDSLVRGPAYSSPQPQDNSNDNVLIAEGVEVSRVKLHRCNHRQPRQLVSDLLGTFFSRREMATHSLTGHKSGSTEGVKPALDNIRLNAIFDYTLTKFPMANIKDLRKVVRNRLNSESTLCKKTLKRETRQPDLCTESTSSAEGPEGQGAGPFIKEEFIKKEFIKKEFIKKEFIKEEFIKEEFIKEEDQDADPEYLPSQSMEEETNEDHTPPCRISSVCSQSYAALLRQHGKSHLPSKPFPCNICGKRFTQKSTMTRHMRSHSGLKPYACGECSMRFTRQYRLTEHMQCHLGETPYKCHLCRWKFTHQHSLISHLRSSHGKATLSAI